MTHLTHLRLLATCAVVVCSLILSACARPTPTPSGPRPAANLALQPPQAQAAVYDLVEINVATDAVIANPFDPTQFDLWARFTAPSGRVIRVPAFYFQDFDRATLAPQGAPVWRVRFTPSEAGNWQAQAELASPPLISPAITLTVKPAPQARGFVRIAPSAPRYFSFDNGDLYLPIGPNIAWASGQDLVVLKDYTRWFDALGRNGGNATRVWMASWAFGLEWKDTGLGDYRSRLKQAWLLDQVFELAGEHDIRIMLTLLNHGAFSKTTNPEWSDNPFNVANGGMLTEPQEFAVNPLAKDLFKRRLRYIAARYAASTNLFAWEWWNEVNWTPIGDPQLEPWIKEMTLALESWDPYHHPISVSYASGGATRLWAMPEISFAQQHDYSGRDPLLELRAAYQSIGATAGARPILMSEHGYSAGGAATEFGREEIHMHNGVWAAVFMGYAGSAMAWWWDTFIEPQGMWSTYKPLADFLAGEDVRPLAPAEVQTDGEANVLCLQSQERALMWIRNKAYEANAATRSFEKALKEKKAGPGWKYEPPLLSGLTITVTQLMDGDYSAAWFDPQTGRWLAEMAVQARGGALSLRAPDFRHDLALKLRPAKKD